ncbi:MAG: YciI family protein [Chloroflexi bacterium]|nr:YciI family protein [Chloroflexota bacterium]MBV9545751.1 YciI family protein [Chloroflexota bacterium]
MRYLLLIAGDENKLNNGQRTEAWGTYTQDLATGNNLRGGERLRPSTSATTVRLNGGSRLVSDGPYAETKEQLGGFYLIEATDLDQAVELASKMPHLEDGGVVEIRPIWDM